MTKELTPHQRELFLALLDGKTIQQAWCGTWADCESLAIAAQYIAAYPSSVRIKPEPRKSTIKAYANESGIFLRKDPAHPAVALEVVTVTYYPDEPDRDKRVVATIEGVKP